MLNKLSCFFGFHSWKYSRTKLSYDFLPLVFSRTTPYKRECLKCGKKQIWNVEYKKFKSGE